MCDNVFIVSMHVYPINNGGGPRREYEKGAKIHGDTVLSRNLGRVAPLGASTQCARGCDERARGPG